MVVYMSCWIICFELIVFLSWHVEARPFFPATILPFGRGTNDEKGKKDTLKASTEENSPKYEDMLKKLPPPPPPPEGTEFSIDDRHQNHGTLERTNHNEQEPPPPPPPPQNHWISRSMDHSMTVSQDSQGWVANSVDWNQQSMGNVWPPPQQNHYQQPYPMMHHEIESLFEREAFLLQELQNATASIAAYAQRDELHMCQLDVLTERVIAAESAAAAERNELLEYKVNCTELTQTVAKLQDDIEEWTLQCRNLTQQHDDDLAQIQKLKLEIKERNREVENLATTIETARLETERDRYIVERKGRKKKRGFFAWLFGMSSKEDEDEDKMQTEQEFARSTLLRALQAERESVNELETALYALQQNNSAISEMVQSRDNLIEELNNRVAVFEEDKLVLKAALKQLQKEMKDEGPKTQKVLDDLKVAREELERLGAQIESMQAEHKSEVKALKGIISQKEASINSTESNMTVIGSYVDKLEERLASFAIARRDIEVREQKCKELEEKASLWEIECTELRNRLNNVTSEQDELKSLLEDLVKERGELQKTNASLSKERSGLLANASMLRDTISSLEIDVDSLGKVLSEWKLKVTELESEIESRSAELARMEQREKELLATMELKDNMLDQMQKEKSDLEDIVTTCRSEIDKLKEMPLPSIPDSQPIELSRNDYLVPPPPPLLPTTNDSHDSTNSNVQRETEEELPQHLDSSSKSVDGQTSESPTFPVESDESNRLVAETEVLDAGTPQQPDASLIDSHMVRKLDRYRNEKDSLIQGRDLKEHRKPESYSKNSNINSLGPRKVISKIGQSGDDYKPRRHMDRKPSQPNNIHAYPGKPTANSNRKVPFRAIRKAFSRSTGIHGLLTPQSEVKISNHNSTQKESKEQK